METNTINQTTSGNAYMGYLKAAAFVALYIAIGYVFKLKPTVYLLMGIPLTIAFQLGVRRQPLRMLWVRDGMPFALGARGIFIALAFMAEPVREMVVMLIHHRTDAALFVYLVATLGGAIAAAYAVCNLNKNSFRQLWVCLFAAGAIGITLVVLSLVVAGIAKGHAIHPHILKGIKSLLIYIPVCFVMEEVVFRGMLDPVVYKPGKGRGIGSAFFVSMLWGLWHLPVAHNGAASLPATAIVLILVHSFVGIPLSLFWRKSGNLAVTATTHAFIDAVRDAFL